MSGGISHQVVGKHDVHSIPWAASKVRTANLVYLPS
jgi:hypothetical protein